MGPHILMKDGETLRRPPMQRKHRNDGKLAIITSNIIDIEAAWKMDPDYLADILVTRDLEKFEAHIHGGLPDRKKASRFMLHHLDDLEAWNTVERAKLELSYTLPLFTVEKKDPGWLRLIQDCRELNRIFAKPPPMDLPRIHELIKLILSHS